MPVLTAPREGVRLSRLGIEHVSIWEAHESVILDRALVTIDIQIGDPYLYYAPVIDGVRRWVRPPDWLVSATNAWIRYYQSIQYDIFIRKMFAEQDIET